MTPRYQGDAQRESGDNTAGGIDLSGKLGEDKRIRHNHLTRDIKPRGQCPGCDAYCRSGQVEPNVSASPRAEP